MAGITKYPNVRSNENVVGEQFYKPTSRPCKLTITKNNSQLLLYATMPKAEKGSLKDLGKQIKAKGLQKLRFYCQMCEKQCRDANGFKCHLTSDAHLRHMKIFSENSGRILNTNSRQFESIFLDTLRMRHSTAKVNANQVYQQVIADKNHVHMNSTIWSTLSGFVQYLGKTGKCVVEETERGWYITYINRDVGKLQREQAQRDRQQAELEAEALVQQRMELQRVEAAKAFDRATGGEGKGMDTIPTTATGGGKVELQLGKNTNNNPKKRKIILRNKQIFDADSEEEGEEAPPIESHQPPTAATTTITTKQHEESSVVVSKKKSKLAKEGTIPEISNDDIPWLFTNIMVRIVNQKIANGKYYRKKAKIDTVLDDGFTAIVTVKDDDSCVDGDVLKLDQDDLETVVPKQPGGMVQIVRGILRGETATIVQLKKDQYQADLQRTSDGTLQRQVMYDDFSTLV